MPQIYRKSPWSSHYHFHFHLFIMFIMNGILCRPNESISQKALCISRLLKKDSRSYNRCLWIWPKSCAGIRTTLQKYFLMVLIEILTQSIVNYDSIWAHIVLVKWKHNRRKKEPEELKWRRKKQAIQIRKAIK